MEHEVNQVNITEIDFRAMLVDFLSVAKRFLVVGILLVAVLASAFGWRSYNAYSPLYNASASFTVTVTNPLYSGVNTYNAATAEQMAKTFPYILTSGALNDIIKEKLDLPYIPPVSASVHKNTNIFTLSVTSGDPQQAYDVLNAVIEYYPEIAEFVVGPTKMSLLSESGVPTEAINSREFVSAAQRGALIGAAIWLAFLLFFTFTRSTIHNEDELKSLTNLRCLGTVPQCGRAKSREAGSWPVISESGDRFGFTESVRLARIRAEKEMKKHGYKVMLISSAIPGEGKTTVASNIAMSFAQKGKRTLLIDFDMRNPSVNKVFSKPSTPGLSGLLDGTFSFEDILVEQAEHLYVIFAGVPNSNAAELLSRPEFRKLIAEARKDFEYIVIDTPPCAMLADASEAAALADCALLTIRQNYSSKDQVLEGASYLSSVGLPIIGCVLNGAQRNILTGSYGYGYGYNSGYGYGYGYGYGSGRRS